MLFTFVIVFAFFTQRSSQGIPSISTSDLSETSIATEYRPPNSGKGCINGHTKLDEKDCTAYYECVNNCYELRLCAYGKFYDPEEGCCRADYVCPNRGITQTRSRPVKGAASECTNGDVRSDPSDCTKYFRCSGDPPQFKLETCASGERFSTEKKHCTEGPCEENRSGFSPVSIPSAGINEKYDNGEDHPGPYPPAAYRTTVNERSIYPGSALAGQRDGYERSHLSPSAKSHRANGDAGRVGPEPPAGNGYLSGSQAYPAARPSAASGKEVYSGRLGDGSSGTAGAYLGPSPTQSQLFSARSYVDGITGDTSYSRSASTSIPSVSNGYGRGYQVPSTSERRHMNGGSSSAYSGQSARSNGGMNGRTGTTEHQEQVDSSAQDSASTSYLGTPRRGPNGIPGQTNESYSTTLVANRESGSGTSSYFLNDSPSRRKPSGTVSDTYESPSTRGYSSYGRPSQGRTPGTTAGSYQRPSAGDYSSPAHVTSFYSGTSRARLMSAGTTGYRGSTFGVYPGSGSADHPSVKSQESGYLGSVHPSYTAPSSRKGDAYETVGGVYSTTAARDRTDSGQIDGYRTGTSRTEAEGRPLGSDGVYSRPSAGNYGSYGAAEEKYAKFPQAAGSSVLDGVGRAYPGSPTSESSTPLTTPGSAAGDYSGSKRAGYNDYRDQRGSVTTGYNSAKGGIDGYSGKPTVKYDDGGRGRTYLRPTLPAYESTKRGSTQPHRGSQTTTYGDSSRDESYLRQTLPAYEGVTEGSAQPYRGSQTTAYGESRHDGSYLRPTLPAYESTTRGSTQPHRGSQTMAYGDSSHDGSYLKPTLPAYESVTERSTQPYRGSQTTAYGESRHDGSYLRPTLPAYESTTRGSTQPHRGSQTTAYGDSSRDESYLRPTLPAYESVTERSTQPYRGSQTTAYGESRHDGSYLRPTLPAYESTTWGSTQPHRGSQTAAYGDSRHAVRSYPGHPRDSITDRPGATEAGYPGPSRASHGEHGSARISYSRPQSTGVAAVGNGRETYLTISVPSTTGGDRTVWRPSTVGGYGPPGSTGSSHPGAARVGFDGRSGQVESYSTSTWTTGGSISRGASSSYTITTTRRYSERRRTDNSYLGAQARVHSEDQGGLNGEHTGAEQARGPPGSAIGSYLGAENSYSTSSVSHADGSPFDTTVLRGGGGIYNTAQPSTMSRERNTVPEWINELCEESGGPSGYRADPHDCHRYFQCAQAHWVHKDCPSNLVWNPAKNVCDWPHAGLKC